MALSHICLHSCWWYVKVKVGFRREDVHCQSKWCVALNQIAAGLR